MEAAERVALDAKVAALEAEVAALQAQLATSRTYETYVRALLDASSLAIYLKRADNTYVFANAQLARLAGRTSEEFPGHTDVEMWPREHAELFRSQDAEVLRRSEPVDFEETVAVAGDMRSYITSKFPLFDAGGEPYAVGGICTDITALKASEQAREALIDELQAALAKIKALEGILPVCAHCRRIQDDAGAWHGVEAYLETRTNTRLSHGICPSCLETHYGDYLADRHPQA